MTNRIEPTVKRLAAAVLVTAVEDLASPIDQRRRAALAWVAQSRAAPFSFEFCCSILDRDPEGLRQRLQSVRFTPKLALGKPP